MKKTRLDNWICEIESLPELTREGLDALQLRRLNETLSRLKARGGIYAGYPEGLYSLGQLETLPDKLKQALQQLLFTEEPDSSIIPVRLTGMQSGE